MRYLVILIGLFLLPVMSSTAAEIIYPAGLNISGSYLFNSQEIPIGDTLQVTRQLTNNEPGAISGLYFSDNFPAAFTIVAHSVKINNVPIDYIFYGPFSDYELSGYQTCFWIIDDPLGGVANSVESGDDVTLEIKIVCPQAGDYELPFHSLTGYNGTTGLFSIAETDSVSFYIVLDVDDPANEDQIPDDFLFTAAYPNPFNAAVRISFESGTAGVNNADLEIFDILGRTVYRQSEFVGSNANYFIWIPSAQTGSGVYFYRLTFGRQSDYGKILLLK